MNSVVGGQGKGARRARIAVEAHQCSCLTIVDSALALTGHWAPSAAMKLTHQASGLSSWSFVTFFLARVFSGHVNYCVTAKRAIMCVLSVSGHRAE